MENALHAQNLNILKLNNKYVKAVTYHFQNVTNVMTIKLVHFVMITTKLISIINVNYVNQTNFGVQVTVYAMIAWITVFNAQMPNLALNVNRITNLKIIYAKSVKVINIMNLINVKIVVIL